MDWEPNGLIAWEKASTLVDPSSTCVYISRSKVPLRLLDILDKGKKKKFKLIHCEAVDLLQGNDYLSVYFSQIIEEYHQIDYVPANARCLCACDRAFYCGCTQTVDQIRNIQSLKRSFRELSQHIFSRKLLIDMTN